MLNSLMNLYEKQAFELYRTHSYQECRELLEIASTSRQTPENRIQELENERFNLYLDKVAYNKFKWAHMDTKQNLWQIKAMSAKLLHN